MWLEAHFGEGIDAVCRQTQLRKIQPKNTYMNRKKLFGILVANSCIDGLEARLQRKGDDHWLEV